MSLHINKDSNKLTIGNNDSRQVDFIAALYRLLKINLLNALSNNGENIAEIEKQLDAKLPTIYISIFGLSETEAMIQRFRELGIREKHLVAKYDCKSDI